MNLREWLGRWMIALISVSAAAEAAVPARPDATLTLELSDGSRLIGQCAPIPLAVAAEYARMEVPLDQISQIVFDDARKMAVVTLRNGTQITGDIQGDIGSRGFQIRSLIGLLTVALEHVRRVEVESGNGGHYNVGKNFSDRQNPAGAWSYGWKMTPQAEFNIFKESRRDEPATAIWFCPCEGPSVAVNMGKETIHPAGTVDLPPGLLDLHPGSGGSCSVVRWTAPRAGNVRITGSFTGLSGYQGAPPTTTDVHVFVNGKESFGKMINLEGQGNNVTFDLQAEVPAGGIVEFMVGFGNGSHGFDGTGLEADIVLSEPKP